MCSSSACGWCTLLARVVSSSRASARDARDVDAAQVPDDLHAGGDGHRAESRVSASRGAGGIRRRGRSRALLGRRRAPPASPLPRVHHGRLRGSRVGLPRRARRRRRRTRGRPPTPRSDPARRPTSPPARPSPRAPTRSSRSSACPSSATSRASQTPFPSARTSDPSDRTSPRARRSSPREPSSDPTRLASPRSPVSPSCPRSKKTTRRGPLHGGRTRGSSGRIFVDNLRTNLRRESTDAPRRRR